ncbi:hypothetical protein HF329_21675 [Chitinophaga oryzae]|uniref:Uncharacterized protein n=1 Tax=Chitinophaga oryzae TaxID=2725414 RepID=A0AAE7D8U7_9BACT|nr:hypothetical protein [Chitinophaga oryzae]QJB33783.1 hypothetical protein HF329_21675 [Chitinophaga oryzae]
MKQQRRPQRQISPEMASRSLARHNDSMDLRLGNAASISRLSREKEKCTPGEMMAAARQQSHGIALIAAPGNAGFNHRRKTAVMWQWKRSCEE